MKGFKKVPRIKQECNCTFCVDNRKRKSKKKN